MAHIQIRNVPEDVHTTLIAAHSAATLKFKRVKRVASFEVRSRIEAKCFKESEACVTKGEFAFCGRTIGHAV